MYTIKGPLWYSNLNRLPLPGIRTLNIAILFWFGNIGNFWTRHQSGFIKSETWKLPEECFDLFVKIWLNWVSRRYIFSLTTPIFMSNTDGNFFVWLTRWWGRLIQNVHPYSERMPFFTTDKKRPSPAMGRAVIEFILLSPVSHRQNCKWPWPAETSDHPLSELHLPEFGWSGDPTFLPNLVGYKGKRWTGPYWAHQR